MTPMNTDTPVIEIHDLVRRYGRTDAVNGLSLRVQPGRCYGFFGRNGAGKTTTIKCLLNLLRPTSGEVQVFGLDPAQHEVAVKSRLAYVPDNVAFYPWMTVRDTLDYFASFRAHWNRETERALLDQFRLDVRPEDEPPLEGPAHAARAHHRDLPRARAARARRADVRPRSDRPPRVHPDGHRRLPGRRSRAPDGVRLDASHLRVRRADRRVHDHRAAAASVLTLDADAARERYQKIYARFADRAGRRSIWPAPACSAAARREVEVVVNGNAADVLERLKARSPETLTTEALTLEEIFVATLQPRRRGRMMLARVLPLPVAKEVRALLPALAGSLVARGRRAAAARSAGPLGPGRALRTARRAPRSARCRSATSTPDRTLPMLLSQPASRARLFVVKQSVLAVMLARAAAVAWRAARAAARRGPRAMVVALSVLCAPVRHAVADHALPQPAGRRGLHRPVPGWIWLLVGLFVREPAKLAVFEWGDARVLRGRGRARLADVHAARGDRGAAARTCRIRLTAEATRTVRCRRAPAAPDLAAREEGARPAAADARGRGTVCRRVAGLLCSGLRPAAAARRRVRRR